MNFKGKVSTWWKASILLIHAALVAVFLVTFDISYTFQFLPAVLIIDLYLIPVMFRNYVTLDKNYVVVYFGLMKKTIPVKDIVLVKSVKNSRASFAASSDRLSLQIEHLADVEVSLEDPNGFVKKLSKYNRKIMRAVGE